MSSSSERGRLRWPGIAPILWLVVFAFGLFRALQQSWVADDVFVTFRYADNVLAGHGPVYNPGERSEGYTHFLWFVLLTVGRIFGVEAETLGRFLGIPFFVASAWLLVDLSSRLFPGRGGWRGVPAAALAWLLLEDAQLYASGGLETPLLGFLLLLGFRFLCEPAAARPLGLAAWAFGTAALVRPDGLLFAGVALAFVAWSTRLDRRRVGAFAGILVLLVAPLFVFRLLYYGHWFPNPYYAKSGNLSYWSQGWWYLSSYFGAYFVFLAALVPVARVFPSAGRALPATMRELSAAWRGQRPAAPEPGAQDPPALEPARGAQPLHSPALPLAYAFVAAFLHVLYVTRIGGDFMFARFYLPATPFLLLLCESCVQWPRRRGLRLAAAVALMALTLAGAALKHARFSGARHYHGVVDEPQFYPRWRLAEMREIGDALRPHVAGTGAKFLVLAGQLTQAYYGAYPVAVEFCGLTDEHVAHAPLRARGRPGHEKYADAEYVYQRAVNFRVRTERQMRQVRSYAACSFPGPHGWIYGEIIVYDRGVMQKLRENCPKARFLDFPAFLEQTYLPRVASEPPARLVEDYNHFKRYYFGHNPDPEGLHARLRDALAARGLGDIPPRPLPPDLFRDQSSFEPP